MSSTIYNLFGMPDGKCDKRFVVSNIQQRIAEYVAAKMEEFGLNDRAVASKSRGLISHTTVYDVKNQRSKDITLTTIQGLIKGLNVPPSELFTVALGIDTTQETIGQKLSRYIDDLPKENQQFLEVIIKALYQNAERDELSAPPSTTPNSNKPSSKISKRIKSVNDISEFKISSAEELNNTKPERTEGARFWTKESSDLEEDALNLPNVKIPFTEQ